MEKKTGAEATKDTTIYLRTTTVQENGEKTFTLTPVVSKAKAGEHEVSKKNAKKYIERYRSLFKLKKLMPMEEIERNEDGSIIPFQMFSEQGLDMLSAQRAVTAQLKAEVTETYTVTAKNEKTFAKTRTIKREFDPRQSMTLSSTERDTRLAEHKEKRTKVKNALKLIASKMPLLPNSYPDYHANTEARKARQKNAQAIHNSKMLSKISILQSKVMHSCPEIVAITEAVTEKDGNGMYTNVDIAAKVITNSKAEKLKLIKDNAAKGLNTAFKDKKKLYMYPQIDIPYEKLMKVAAPTNVSDTRIYTEPFPSLGKYKLAA